MGAARGDTAIRIALTLLGVVCIFAGVPLLVTAGPGLPLMALGVGLLVYEFRFRARKR